MKDFWLTPKEIYDALDAEFKFNFDPCPFPRPENFNGLAVAWGTSNFVNPPFRLKDAFKGAGPTAFARRAIAEKENGNRSVLLLPVQSYVALLVAAGASVRSLGRVKWISTDSADAMPSPTSICAFVL